MARAIPLVLGVALAAALGIIRGGSSAAADGPTQTVAGPAAALAPDAPIADPFPIIRLRTDEAHVSELLKQLKPGPLVLLSRSDFEGRVRAAGRAAADAKIQPRISDVRIRATLTGGDLVGTAELDVTNPAPTARFLPLDPLRIALAQAAWGDGKEAVAGIPSSGGTAALWVDRPGLQTLKLDWSLAGTAEFGEHRFELRVPTAPTATLSLVLPSGQVPTSPASDVLITGPFPVADTTRWEWRFRFGGRPRLDFAVRPAGNSGVTTSASLVAKYDITPGLLTCGFEYDLHPAKGTVGEWAFNVEPGLRVTDVVVNNRAGWVVDPPTTPGGSRILRVALHQPGAGGKVLVSAVAPRPDLGQSADAPLPVVRPVGANLDDETIEIRLAPGLKPEHWHAGDYRLTEAQVLPDQSRSLTLTGTLLPAGADRSFRQMPHFHAATVDPEFTTTQELRWRIDAPRASVSLRDTIRIRRGSLFHSSLRIPAGYSLVRVESAPDDLVLHHTVTGGAVTVEYSRAISAGQSIEIRYEFRGPALNSTPQSLPFPDFVPVGAAERTGFLTIEPGPLWRTDPVPGVGARPAAWFDFAEARVPAGAAAAYLFRGASADGVLNLIPVRGEFTAHAESNVLPIPGGLLGTNTFTVRIASGGLHSLVAIEAAGGAAQRNWHVSGGGNAVASVLPLPLDKLPTPLATAVFEQNQSASGARAWFIQFARPVTGELTLETQATRAFTPSASEEVRAAARDAFSQWVILGASASHTDPTQALGPREDHSPRDWRFSSLYLVTVVRSTTDASVVFGGTVDSAASAKLPVRLPSGARLHAVAVDGRWLEPSACRLSEEGELLLPLSGRGASRIEVRYQLAVKSNWPVTRIESPEPFVPAESSMRRWWVFAREVLPGWPICPWPESNATALPQFFGDSPAAWGSGLVVSDENVQSVHVAPTRFAEAIGFAGAGVLVALLWAGGRPRCPGIAVGAIGCLLLIGIVDFLGPPWWKHAATLPLLVGLAALAIMLFVRSRGMAGLAGAVTAGLVFLGQADIGAQLPSLAVVVLLPPNETGRETVLAPKSVLDRLTAEPAASGPVIVSSTYALTADTSGARVVATYIVHALADTRTIVTLPLAESRLERVTIDQNPAFPAAPRPGVYTVPLPGLGRHEIKVSFAVPLTGTGPEREIRFGAPECPITRVTAELPGAAKQAQMVGAMGRQTLLEAEQVKLEADVGAVRTVHLRWREGLAGTAAIKVREGCVWDVTESGAELTACYLVRVEQGTVGSLPFAIPAELDPLAVSARSIDPTGGAALSDWKLGPLQGGFRTLRLDFQAPVAGRLLVVLTLSPRHTITRHPTLRFPRPILPGTSSELDAAYGLRVKGVAIESPGLSGMIDYAPDALLRDFGAVAELRLDPGAPIRVFRPTHESPELHPTLHASADPPAATLETSWDVGPNGSVATGRIRWAGKDAPSIVEFALPGVTVLEVRGTEVAAWGHAGSRVQVWFRRPVKEGELEWVGKAASPAAPFDAVTPRLADMHLVSDTVRLRAPESYTVQIERDRGWTEDVVEGPAVLTRSTPATQPVRVRLIPAPRPLRASDLGWIGTPRESPAPADALWPRAAPPPSGLPPPPIDRDHPPAVEDWDGPVSAAAGWVLATLVLAVLVARFPRRTRPEQLGLVAGLFAVVLVGYWWIGIAVWLAARFAARFDWTSPAGGPSAPQVN